MTLVTGTTITTSSTATVSTSALASSDTSIVGVNCDQTVACWYAPLGQTASIVTATAKKFSAESDMTITVPANNGIGCKSYGAGITAICNLVRGKK